MIQPIGFAGTRSGDDKADRGERDDDDDEGQVVERQLVRPGSQRNGCGREERDGRSAAQARAAASPTAGAAAQLGAGRGARSRVP